MPKPNSIECLLVLPIEHMPLNLLCEKGAPLPLHCTVMHWFCLTSKKSPEGHVSDLIPILESITRAVSSDELMLVSEQAARFDPEGRVPVHVLARNRALNLMHTEIFTYLARNEMLPERIEWIGADYRPHVTDVGERAFLPGMQHTPTHLTVLIRKAGGPRLVLGEWEIGSGEYSVTVLPFT